MGEWLNQLFNDIPPLACYILVGLVIGLESMGIPLPGEVTLIGVLLLHLSNHSLKVEAIIISAILGAVIGDNIGYFIGHRWGYKLLNALEVKFPKHFSQEKIHKVEDIFEKYGVWAIFFGRFVALLRIFSGPIAGALHIKYWKFLLANVSGATAWVGVITALVYSLGKAAEKLISQSSWLLLVAIGIIGALYIIIVRQKRKRAKV